MEEREKSIALYKKHPRATSLTAYIAQLEKIIARLDTKKMEMDRFVNSLTDDRIKRIVELHVVDGLTLEKCAEQMHYSTRGIMLLWQKVKDQCREWQ